jgi:hypothetical protein
MENGEGGEGGEEQSEPMELKRQEELVLLLLAGQGGKDSSKSCDVGRKARHCRKLFLQR